MDKKELFSDIEAVVFDLDDVLVSKHLMQFIEDMQMLQFHDKVPRRHREKDIVVGHEFMEVYFKRKKRAKVESQGDPRKYYEILIDGKLRPDFDELHESGIKKVAEQGLIQKSIGAEEILSKISQSALRCALLTNRERKFLTPLYTADIITNNQEPREEGYFDLTVSASDMGIDQNGNPLLKPSTAGLELIINHFQIEPKKIVMIGDLPSDIIPAQKLGTLTVGIAEDKESEQLLNGVEANIIVNNVSELIPILPLAENEN